MRRPGRLLGAAGTTFALALGGLGAGAAPATASPLPIDQCTTTSGVVLAVDFGHWGGPLLRSCGTTPTTGYALLNQGGWKTTGTGHDGPAFICRIGYSGHQGGKQYPTPDQDKCVLTPPAAAYWSYWHADPGQDTWSYSQLGAMSYKPKPGSVDLWIFGGTDIEGTEGRPTISPDTVRAHNTAPGGTTPSPAPERPTTPPAGGGNGVTTGGSSSGGSGTKPATAGAGTPQPGGTTASDGASPTPGTSTEPTPTPTPSGSTEAPGPVSPTAAPSPGTTPVDAAPTADAPHSAGSIAPAVVGVALVVALGVATGLTALRRRRQAE
ncbi:hypothetical protein [Kitasatospora sp. NBC_00070]|uniref:hypothetical protein n=1 Tax=Kitasatospora sp. NBC_00070 TaxID=2975962 RepID=UPI00386025C9